MIEIIKNSTFYDWENRTSIKPKGYVRVNSPTDNIVWFFGFDEQGRNTFRFDIRFSVNLLKDYSSKSIEVTNIKNVEKSSILFTLCNQTLSDVFATLFEYLVSKIPENLIISKIPDKVFEEYGKWSKMFNRGKVGLDEIEQRGLIGELLYIKDSVNSGLNISDVINAWCGIDFEEVDFAFPNYWAEIKTRLSTSSIIHINSVGQLDHANDGYLIIYTLSNYEEGVSLNDVYEEVHNLVENQHNPTILSTFEERLETYGYFKLPIYNRHHYSLTEKRIYIVNNSFPKIHRDVKTPHMKHINYSLIVDSLEEWRQRD